ICEVNPVTGLAVVPSNCDSVTDTIVVLNPIDAVVDVYPTQTPSTTAPTTVGNVTTNDTLNGVPVTADNTDVTPVTEGPLSIDDKGVLTLAPNTPSGSYPITYTICEVNPVTGLAVVPSNCDSVTDTIVVLNIIDAANDVMPTTNGGLGNPMVGNVLTNDTFNGIPVKISDVNVMVSNPATPLTPGAPVPVIDRVTGIVSVPAGTPSATYTITYQICEKLNDTNCDTAIATIPVGMPIIDAVDDDYTGIQIYSYPGGRTGVVLENDTLNGNPIVLGRGDVKLTGITVPVGLTLNDDGTISVSPNSASGIYIVNYTICDVINPTNCDSAIATIKVLAQNPAIALVKTATFLDENGDGLAQVGEKIRYNFVVTNTGDVPLINIAINDPLPGVVVSGGPISLLPGESDSTSFTGTYAITVQDLNQGSVSNQATASGTSPRGIIVKDLSDENSNTKDEPTVIIVSGCKVEVFNLVSPNGDGANDYLHIEGLDCYPKNSVEIYNRWGVLVYSAEGYNNNEVSFKGFSDGRVTIKQSEGLPDGTYYYILKFTDFEGRILSKAGYLYLTK
ncbi:gliding motility-associated C-terminal domain-containing protein, partial [Flavobacterium aquidurense]|uniref:gliding motility-associated C-terminal domain-containing protein n=1 Tax=Flavobacterium aquidurense TaxID=362413 RepID=UPI00286BD081